MICIYRFHEVYMSYSKWSCPTPTPWIIQLSFSGIVHEINHPAIGVATFALAAWPHAQQGGARGARQGASWLQGMLVNPGVNQPRVEFFWRMLSMYDIYIYCIYIYTIVYIYICIIYIIYIYVAIYIIYYIYIYVARFIWYPSGEVQ